ncbi:mechanosensitive ion channel [Candidatus Synechococcus calcipolaris G9]|uniref:Mechanosensitive ion channel n=1 Tax=Candidatus Synechococcus calcipolaris G9 TaxID=1497997 RepID=A0ABT6EU15_9SYNE|nr:mechanosensitive ion channel [Candidatus Synechococcus calcipolaris]MDG2989401.1 mechanosensitive ion channel [Candidatus Synechococcus calcipolaris G9]
MDIISCSDSANSPLTIFAQMGTPSDFSQGTDFIDRLIPGGLGDLLVQLVGAIALLLLGWIVAILVAKGVNSLLHRTHLDNRLTELVSGQQGGPDSLAIEALISKIIFWVIMLLAVIAALNALNLTEVSRPLNTFLDEISVFLPRLGSAAALGILAWILATIVKTVVTRLGESLNLDQKLVETTTTGAESSELGAEPSEGSDSGDAPTFKLSSTLGNLLYWFVFLFFLPTILGVLNLEGPLQPVQHLLDELLSALPKVLKAILIGGVGWVIARIVKGLVTNLLAAAGADRLIRRLPIQNNQNQYSISALLGMVVYVLILIPTAIAALEALEIQAITVPAVNMLNQILAAVPQIFTAIVILIIAFFVGQFIQTIVTTFLTGLGFDNIFRWIGLPIAVAGSSSSAEVTPDTPENLETQDSTSTYTPSQFIGVVVLVVVMLFAVVAATNVLGFAELTQITTELLRILGQVIAGLVVFAIGLYLANLAFNVIRNSGGGKALILAQAARISIIILVAAMSLQQIGIAPNIINLAFGLLMGALAVAIAIAFGFGGRELAGEQLRHWLEAFQQKDSSR